MSEPCYFERMYRDAADPWDLDGNPYERRKYEITLASLPRPRYRRAFEPGCSVGVLTQMLAPRCDAVVATDLVPAPVEVTRRRVPRATVSVARLPDEWPAGSFDLIVLSELLYYLSASEREGVLERVETSLEPEGHLAVVHWLHPFDEAESDGLTVHREVDARPALDKLIRHREADFLLEVFRRRGIGEPPDATSLASSVV